MLKQVIEGWNACPGAPPGWNPDIHGPCDALPIRVVDRGSPRQCCESAWEPTPGELELLNAGGRVILRVSGWQVPVTLFVEPRPADTDPCPA